MVNIRKLVACAVAVVMVISMGACAAPAANETAAQAATTAAQTATTAAQTAAEAPAEELYYNTDTYKPIVKEPIQITVSGVQRYTPDWSDTVMTKVIKDELGIELVPSPFPKDSMASQYALMLANNEQPDMLINMHETLTKEQINIDGDAGFWLDLSQYLDIMPNFKKTMEENPEWAESTYTADGKIYGIDWFKCADVARIGGMIFLNKELAAGAGITSQPTTIDEFYDALVALKKTYPDMVTLGMTPDRGWTQNEECILLNSFGIHGVRQSFYMMSADANGQVSLLDLTDNNREYIKFLNKLYTEGILDQECLIRTPEEYRAKEFGHEICVFSDSGFNYPSQGEPNGFYWIPALTSEYCDDTWFTLQNKVMNDGVQVVVKADTQYPEAICRLIDYMFTEEGSLLAGSAGVEGVSFDYIPNDYGLKIWTTEAYADLNEFETASAWQNAKVSITQAMCFFNGLDRLIFNGLDPAVLEKVAVDESIDLNTRTYAYQALQLNTVHNVIDEHKPMTYTSDEQQERVTLYTDISNYITTMKASFISGEKNINDDAEWNAFIEQIKAMGYDRLMEIETAAWNR